MTILFIEQLIQNSQTWLWRRSLDRAITRAYPTFARQYPEWAAACFDERFLSSRLSNAELGLALPMPVVLARAWVEQFSGFDDTVKQRLIAEATPVALAFLRLLNAELYDREFADGLIPQVA